jgi:hypothetical protein
MTRRPALIDPSGRPLKNPGFEALVALGLIGGWIALVALVFLLTMRVFPGFVEPAPVLASIGVLAWVLAEHMVGRHALVWPGSALGLIGPLSVGFALSIATPELRAQPKEIGIAIVAGTSAALMILFLFRFRSVPWAIGFGLGGFGALLLARRLDLKGDDFGLAAARPLHLIGAGITALVLGRAAAMLPAPGDMLVLALLWIVAVVWTMRINRFAVMVACHFAMAKPMVMSIATPLGLTLDLRDWTILLTALLLFDLVIWPSLHKLSQRIGWTLGPGGRIPPTDRKGFIWRYWPYA